MCIRDSANTGNNGLNILNHTADANVDTGIAVEDGNGKLNILTPTVTNNGINGIRITDFTNIVGDTTVIAGVGGNIGLLDDNGLGGSNQLIELTQPGLLQNVLITDLTVSNGDGDGIDAIATGIGTELNIDIRDGVTVTGNLGDGISLAAFESAVINANIGNPDLTTPPLEISNNAFLGEAGIAILAQGTAGNLDLATVNANITNVAIINDESLLDTSGDGPDTFFNTTGIEINSIDAAIVDVTVTDSTIGNPAQDPNQNVQTGVDILLDNDTSFGRDPNRIVLDNLESVSYTHLTLPTKA